MTESRPVVAIIGAGNVGCALAADLVLREAAEVRLCNRSPARLEAIAVAGGLTATGAVDGFVPLDRLRLTTAVKEAVVGADVVAVTVPTPALPSYAGALADLTTAGQLLWLDPGHSGGALYLAAEFERRTGRRGRVVCQLSTSSHGARMSGPATVGVFALPALTLGAFPGTAAGGSAERVAALLTPAERVTPAETVLEVDLLNVNAVLHPPLMIGNAGWIEATGGRFPIYRDGAGPALCRLIEAVEADRRTLADRLGLPTVGLVDHLAQAGYTTAGAAATGSLHAALQGSESVAGITAPPALDHRYLHEDVGWGLVPWLHLAGHAGVATPVIEAVVGVAGALNGVDYRTAGLTLEGMGLAGVAPSEIVAWARSGASG